MRSEARLPMHPPVSRYDQGPRSGFALEGFYEPTSFSRRILHTLASGAAVLACVAVVVALLGWL